MWGSEGCVEAGGVKGVTVAEEEKCGDEEEEAQGWRGREGTEKEGLSEREVSDGGWGS